VPKIVDHAERRGQLLDAASQVLLEYGLGGLTTRRVTEAAGEAKGALSHYFDNKDDLVRQLLERFYERIRRRLISRLEGLSGLDALGELMLELLPLDDARLGEAQVELSFVAASVGSPDLTVWYHDQRRQLKNVLMRYTKQAQRAGEIDPSRAAKLIVDGFLTLMDGLSMQAVLNPSPSHRRSQRQQLTSFLVSLR
jgi:AcrR family transcriptional regulator|tara:strand:+ start:4283 stop:4870 length:588 start_codon:yes stop_codon:yes gene_type:complete